MAKFIVSDENLEEATMRLIQHLSNRFPSKEVRLGEKDLRLHWGSVRHHIINGLIDDEVDQEIAILATDMAVDLLARRGLIKVREARDADGLFAESIEVTEKGEESLLEDDSWGEWLRFEQQVEVVIEPFTPEDE